MIGNFSHYVDHHPINMQPRPFRKPIDLVPNCETDTEESSSKSNDVLN